MKIKVEIGTDEQFAMMERLQDILNETPNVLQQHVIIELLMASHALRMEVKADMVLDGMNKHAKQMIKNYVLQQPGETRQ